MINKHAIRNLAYFGQQMEWATTWTLKAQQYRDEGNYDMANKCRSWAREAKRDARRTLKWAHIQNNEFPSEGRIGSGMIGKIAGATTKAALLARRLL